MMTHKKSIVLVTSSLCAILLFTLLPTLTGSGSYAMASKDAVNARAQLEYATDLSATFRNVARSLRPSVVNISTVQNVKTSGVIEMHPFMHESPFSGLFGITPFDGLRQRLPEMQQRSGLGTGVIVSDDGYILTNNHVVANADEITVSLLDDRSFTAEVVGADQKTDLAVLKVDAKDLLPATLGDSDAIEVGEWVLAVGNPFGLEQTVTSGIISAKGRANMGIAEYEDFIQTDAAINPGNSGGPLVDLRGNVIGINTAISSRTGGYMGVGFAIPMNMAKDVMDKIIEDGRVIRGWLGVSIQDLTPDLAASFNFDGTDGVLISDVMEDGPAADGGIRSGDIVLEYRGQALSTANDLRHAVAKTRPGTKADVVVIRRGDRKELTVEIGEREANLTSTTIRRGNADLGLSVETLTPALANRLQGNEKEGVLVTQVKQGGVAHRAGIRAGDVIVSINDVAIDDVRSFRDALESADVASGIRLQVSRDGLRRYHLLKSS